jgi:hypothetical protein
MSRHQPNLAAIPGSNAMQSMSIQSIQSIHPVTRRITASGPAKFRNAATEGE